MKRTLFLLMVLGIASQSLGCKRYFARKFQDDAAAGTPTNTMVIEKATTYGTTDLGYVKLGGDFGQVDYLWVQQDGAVSPSVRAPVGAAIDIGGTKVTIGPAGTGTYRVELLQKLMEATTEALEGKGFTAGTTLSLPTSVKIGGAETKGTVTMDLSSYFKKGGRAVLKTVEGGRALSGYVDMKSPRKNVLYVPVLGERIDHYGRAGQMKDVDLVAVEVQGTPTTMGICGPFKDGTTAPRANVDSNITVYSSKDGSVFTKKSFSATKESCPMFTFIKKGEAVKVYASSSEISAWLRSVGDGKK